MKKGSISKTNAISTNDQSMVCGVITSKKRQKSKRIHLNEAVGYIH
jgi:uncharacterized protein YaiL (DUF2058 family)